METSPPLLKPKDVSNDPSASNVSLPQPPDPHDPEAPGAPIAVPDTGESSEGGKLKMIIALVKKAFGVKDIAAMRLSLPASLLEPVPNLEYWNYIDRPDLFAAVNDSPDKLQRMLAIIRFTFTKDVKFVKGKICKPYNSVLGEHFRAHWDVLPVTYPTNDSTKPPTCHQFLEEGHEHAHLAHNLSSPNLIKSSSSISSLSVRSMHSDIKALGTSSEAASTTTLPLAPASEVAHENAPPVRVVFITEQVSHHPPISTWVARCPAKGIQACGVDQISAKISGAGALKVLPGPTNKGIFVQLTSGHGEGEQYRITHPIASVNGIVRGSFYATISESTIITSTGGNSKDQLRAIIEYKEEAWLGKPRFLLEGVIHKYDPLTSDSTYDSWTRVKDVPKELVVAIFEGCWRKKITWRKAGQTISHTLLDMTPLLVIPKQVRPLSAQLPNESRKLWSTVTDHLLKKEYSEATKFKLEIEQKQRDIAVERRKAGVKFTPVYFDDDFSSGIPALTEEGGKALEEELRANYDS